MSDRKYYKDKRGDVCWIEDNWAHYNGLTKSISKNDNFTVANQEEIRRFKTKEKQRANRIKRRKKKEQQILSLIGLTQDDFCRFRDVSLSDNKKNIIVATRENGVNATSIEAVKKASKYLVDRRNDESDNTYAYYTFVNPQKRTGDKR